jgi:hypothetical protein
MIDPQKLQLLARYLERYHGLLQTAQETTRDPKMREEIQALQSFLRDTHARFQEEASKISSTVETEIQQLKKRRDEAEKKLTEAAAQRQKTLEEVAAGRVPVREVDPLLNEKLRSELLEEFGHRDRLPPPQQLGPEAWRDWPGI